MRLKTLILFTSLIVVFNQTARSQIPQFVKEKIELTIYEDVCRIEGHYIFRNNETTHIKRSLFYPFPIDSTLFYPDSIKIINVKENENISFIQSKSGIYFPIEILAKKAVFYKVIYSQKVKNNQIEYILTSTQKWGKPLEQAQFIIKLPLKLDLKYLSYKYDEKIEENNFIIFKIHKKNFMPEKNLIVKWAERLK